MLHSLTVRQPWAWAIAHAGKNIENRNWKPHPKFIGNYIAIHAGLRIDYSGIDYLDSHGFDVPAQLDTSVIVALVKLDSIITKSDSFWFTGRYGWILKEVVVLPNPVHCRGARSLWQVPDQLINQIYRQTGILS